MKIKVIADNNPEAGRVLVTVYANKKLSDSAAKSAAANHLRSEGFIVTDLRVDNFGYRGALVAAYIQ